MVLKLKRAVNYLGVFLLFLVQAAALSAASASDFYNSGRSAQEQGDWYPAIEAYLEAVSINPSYGAAWLALGECSYALEEYQSAVRYFDIASRYLGASPELQNMKGFALIGQGRLAEARELFASVLTAYPNDAGARFGLAELDIFDGRLSSAEQYYRDALRRQPQNRKALLSLALLSDEMGKITESKQYVSQALRYHGDSAEVHYFAGYLLAKEGLWRDAEGRIRSAIQLNGDYDKAYELLALVLYNMGRYAEVVDICDYRTARKRDLPSAWYMKGLSLSKLNRSEDAVTAFTTGLEIAPDDEIMRAALEYIICDTFEMEDPRRSDWARWHITRGDTFRTTYFADQALYEYRRALKIDPYNIPARTSYAVLMLDSGYPHRYLDQLKFIQNLGKGTVKIDDSIEGYQSSLTHNSLASAWKVDPFYLDKTHYSIGIYFIPGPPNMRHPNAEQTTAVLLGDMLSSAGTLQVTAPRTPVSGYSEAFRLARQGQQDYFVLISFEEGDREVSLSGQVYAARTGSSAAELSVFRTGNDYFSAAIRGMLSSVDSLFPVRGRLIARNGNQGLIDLGTTDGIQPEQQFHIIRKGRLAVADEGIGSLYAEPDVLGTFTVTAAGEDISQGTLARNGFYDRINSGDAVLLIAADETAEDGASAPPAAAAAVPETRIPRLINLLKAIQ